MKKTAIALTVAGLLSAGSVLASSPEWVSGWGMGITEYSVNDGRGNELYISCPDDEYEHVKAYATVNGNTKESLINSDWRGGRSNQWFFDAANPLSATAPRKSSSILAIWASFHPTTGFQDAITPSVIA